MHMLLFYVVNNFFTRVPALFRQTRTIVGHIVPQGLEKTYIPTCKNNEKDAHFALTRYGNRHKRFHVNKYCDFLLT